MIDNIFSSSPYIQISGGSSSTYVNGYAGAQGVGNIRYNTSMQKMEVYDGSAWITLSTGAAGINLTGAAQSAIDWALKKMNEESLLKDRMEKHPGLKQAYEQFQIMEILTRKEEDEQGQVAQSP
jgi:hypothetical protein